MKTLDKDTPTQQRDSEAVTAYDGAQTSIGTPGGVHAAIMRGLLPLADELVDVALGNRPGFTSENSYSIKEGWEFLKNAMRSVEAPIHLAGLSEGTISDRVDSVLAEVAQGRLDIQQGKRLIEMLQAGFEITELKDLMAKLESVSNGNPV